MVARGEDHCLFISGLSFGEFSGCAYLNRNDANPFAVFCQTIRHTHTHTHTHTPSLSTSISSSDTPSLFQCTQTHSSTRATLTWRRRVSLPFLQAHEHSLSLSLRLSFVSSGGRACCTRRFSNNDRTSVDRRISWVRAHEPRKFIESRAGIFLAVAPRRIEWKGRTCSATTRTYRNEEKRLRL